MPEIIATINKTKTIAVTIQKIEGGQGGGSGAGVSSFNTRTGAVTLQTSDVLNAVGNGTVIDDNYIPGSIARDSEILTKTLDTTFTPTNSAITLGNTVLQSLEKAQGQINNRVPYAGATTDVDLGNFSLNAKSVHVKGTAGQGHLALKHQSANATASASETAIYADSSGDLKWKNDNLYNTTLKTSTNTADRVYTFPDRSGTLADDTDLSTKADLSITNTKTGVIETNVGTGQSVQSGYIGIDGEFGIVRVVNNKGNVPTQHVNIGTGNHEFWINGIKELEINTANISAENNQIKNVATPTLPTDSATKGYVDSGLSAKQDTLVSGTNIKTVNGSPILGSGDLVVGGGISDGDKGDITVSGSGEVWTIDENTISEAKLTTTLADRINLISEFVSPNAGGVISGAIYDNIFGSTSDSLPVVANQIRLAPYYTSVALPIDLIGIEVLTAGAGVTARILIYDSVDSWPGSLLYESPVGLDCSTTGAKSESITFTFQRGVKYWLGLHASGGATIRGGARQGAPNLGLATMGSSTYYMVVGRNVNYASGAPASFAFGGVGDLVSIVPPSIRFRAV